jgi:hypothetical protein
VLLTHLPRESNYVQAVGGERARWSDTEHLLAGIIDAVQIGNFYTQVIASNRQFKDAPKPPQSFPRPGDKPVENGTRIGRGKGLPRAEMRILLDRWRAGKPEEVSDDGS